MSGEAKTPAYEYLLNRMERAAQSENPFAAGYAEARKDVLAYFAALTALAEAREILLVAERADDNRVGPVINRKIAAERKLAALCKKVGADPGVSS